MTRAAPPLRVVLLGAGYVGSALAAQLASAGHHVWAVRRSRVTEPGPITWVQGDLAVPHAITGLPTHADAIVLTVAPAGADYRTTYVGGAAAALHLADALGAPRLLYTSSTGVYGGTDGRWVDETTPPAGRGPDNAALLDAEAALQARPAGGVTVLRVAGIYGPGRNAAARYRDPAHLAAHGETWVNLAHRDDIVSALTHLLVTPSPSLLNCADGQPAQAREICQWLAEREGRPRPGTFPDGSPPRRSNQRVSSARLQSLGWTPRYPTFREGFVHGG